MDGGWPCWVMSGFRPQLCFLRRSNDKVVERSEQFNVSNQMFSEVNEIPEPLCMFSSSIHRNDRKGK